MKELPGDTPEGARSYTQGKYKLELSMRPFSRAALRFINRKVIVYVSTQGEAKLGEEDGSSVGPAGKVREDERHHLAQPSWRLLQVQ